MITNIPIQFFGVFSGVYVLVMTLFWIAMVLGCILLHLFLTIGVYQEASDRTIRGRKLWFIGPFLWAFATLLGGIVTAAIYWLMHHSTLGPVETTDPHDI